jgi:hypothetical protein
MGDTLEARQQAPVAVRWRSVFRDRRINLRAKRETEKPLSERKTQPRATNAKKKKRRASVQGKQGLPRRKPQGPKPRRYFTGESDVQHSNKGARGDRAVSGQSAPPVSGVSQEQTRRRVRRESSIATPAHYYEPPPERPPFWFWSDAEVEAWLATQHHTYQTTARQLAALRPGISVAAHERWRAEWQAVMYGLPCARCGAKAVPGSAHRRFCPEPNAIVKMNPMREAPKPEPQDTDDDELPF